MLNRYAVILIALILLFAIGMANAESHREAFQFLSPKPGAMYVSKGTYIVIRPGENLSNYSFSYNNPVYIEGSVSGVHDYEIRTAMDGKTLNIVPHVEFTPGERVAVAIDNGLKARTADQTTDFICHFTVSPKQNFQDFDDVSDDLIYGSYYDDGYDDVILTDDPALPSEWPEIVTTTTGTPAPGYIFVNYNGPTRSGWGYAMILENDGDPIYFRKFTNSIRDFKKQETTGLLTFCNYTRRDETHTNTYYVMDQTYAIIDSFQMAGYEVDHHDFKMTADYHGLMATYDKQTINMADSIEGGDSACVVTGCVIQEQDSLKNVVFEWRSWDYLSIFDATHQDFLDDRIDYCHWNTTFIDTDDNLLVSWRHMDEITKIDHQTGDIIWRLGQNAVNNMFTFIGDTAGFSYQHDVQRLSNGNIQIYDNGNYHTPQFSRAVEYALDTTAMTCTQVWEFRHTPDQYGNHMGNAQRLPSNNTLINWAGGADISATEVQYDATIVWEMVMESNPYRTFRFPWTGIAGKPYLFAEQDSSGIHLVFYQFGDASITDYAIYADVAPNPTIPIDSTVENYYYMTDLPNGIIYYIRITGIDYSGIEGGYSNEVEIAAPNLYMPGDANSDDQIIGSDVTFLVNYFRGLSTPPDSCWNANTEDWLYTAADANGDCQNIGSDVTLLVNYFRGTGEIGYCEDTPPLGE